MRFQGRVTHILSFDMSIDYRASETVDCHAPIQLKRRFFGNNFLNGRESAKRHSRG